MANFFIRKVSVSNDYKLGGLVEISGDCTGLVSGFFSENQPPAKISERSVWDGGGAVRHILNNWCGMYYPYYIWFFTHQCAKTTLILISQSDR